MVLGQADVKLFFKFEISKVTSLLIPGPVAFEF